MREQFENTEIYIELDELKSPNEVEKEVWDKEIVNLSLKLIYRS